MHTPYAIRWFLAIGWFLLLSTACSFRDVPAASHNQAKLIPLG